MTASRSRQQSGLTGWGRVVVPTESSPAGNGAMRNQGLDLHRGLAVIAFVLYTVYQYCNVDGSLFSGTPAYPVLNSLDSAVPWLYVLTGFLVFSPVARAFGDGATLEPAHTFLVRRVLRVLPLYWIAIAVVWFARQSSLPGDWRDLVEHLTFTQVFDEQRIFYTDGPAWAVSSAMYFFLAVAALIAVLSRPGVATGGGRNRTTLLMAVTAALGVISIGWKAVAYASGLVPSDGTWWVWFGPLAGLDSFAVGMGLAVLMSVRRGARGPVSPGSCWGLRGVGGALIVVAVLTRTRVPWSVVYFAPVCAVGFACLIAATVFVRSERDTVTRPWLQPLAWLGTISYGIFLWQEPILLAFSGWHGLVTQSPGAFVRDAVVVLAVSIPAGVLSRRLVQLPTERLISLRGTDRTFPRAREAARVPRREPRQASLRR